MLQELRNQLDNKEVSSVELTTQYLDRIKQRNPELNAYVLVTEEYALEQAKAADDVIAKGESTPFTGIPYALKDVFCVEGIETTACSEMLKGYIPPYTASSVDRLAGGVLLGKTNTDEFTCGASTENSCFGPTRNPHDISRVAGGSSGGSAAVVAADMAAFALGTDTGGSIRFPAAFCGTVGLRPTYGRVPRYGVISMASSLDTIGPLTKSVADTAYVLKAIAGPDAFDSTAGSVPVEDYPAQLADSIAGLTIGVPEEYLAIDGMNPEMKAHIEAVIKHLEQLNVTIKPVSLPHTKYAVPTYYLIVPSEISSNMAKYDGIKYGFRAHDAEELLDIYEVSRGTGFGDELKRRIMIGTYALSAGYYDAYYKKAMQVRTLIREDFIKAFTEVDLLITPTAPHTAFTVGAKNDPIQMYLEDIFLAPASLAGVPALSVPVGKLNNLPVGLHIIGPQWSESTILRFGQAVEGLYSNQ